MPRDAVVAPVLVLPRRANDQLLHLTLEPRSARTLTSLRAREFTGDQLAVPGQDRVRPGDRRDLGENLCDPGDDQSRRARLARRPRASLGLSAGHSGCGFRWPDIRSGPAAFAQKMYRNASGTAMLTVDN